MEFLIVGFGGFFGAIARYLIYLGERQMTAHKFPFGTLFINLIGCALAGLLLSFIERSVPVHRHLILLVSMGFIGSFTTFSTFGVETLTLMRTNQLALAILNVSANVILGVLAVWFGRCFFFRW